MSSGGGFLGMDNLSLPQALFMAEAEGVDSMVDTPDARFNAALNEIERKFGSQRGSSVDITRQVDDILADHGFSKGSLTMNQIHMIQSVV